MIGFQVSSRKSLESSLRQLEREKALLQHKSLESHRKAESEADRKRCLENEGEIRESVEIQPSTSLSMRMSCDIVKKTQFTVILPNKTTYYLGQTLKKTGKTYNLCSTAS